ncbi:putative Cytoplasmic tRNA 2-thiolation protein 1 [Daphnia magna]|uniref:Putative Cytoplasmic tRNA 2-thiolation protein 1 n=1 Tax=Daphnia magna TaxID=35525 RepID=A0A164U4H7_9CRUS|nr:putative Cytoplasmic tRNA 2-thiolation protein 1 [Daphnia magna]
MAERVNRVLDRKFYDLSEAYKSRAEFELDETTSHSLDNHSILSPKQENHTSPISSDDFDFDKGKKLAIFVNENVIGKQNEFVSPFGKRQVVYCDYTASGKSLQCIENYITSEVLPTYGNTHTTTSVTSLQTTLFRHEARDILRNSLGASEEDAVIFVGSGCTGAVHKLINGLHLTEPPIVLVGANEHHSNLLPWREIAARVVRIKESSDGLLNMDELECSLKTAKEENRIIIGCFSAASNITGTLYQDMQITALLHRYGALSFWDYATAAPYVKVAMNPTTVDYPSGIAHKDALYFSMHKFVGGVQTPGVLVVKKSLLQNRIPNGAGGGTVFFVDRETHLYLRDAEMREEGGTPAIVESIRAGLVLKLKESVTPEWIMAREDTLVQLAYANWEDIPELILLGSTKAPRLAVFSFMVRHLTSGYYLHHNFVCALLNDVYGIQARGGCACAGPYAQDLLGIDESLAHRYQEILVEDSRLDRTHLRRKEEHSCYEILRPGFARLNLPYFASDSEISFIINAVICVAKNGWKLLPYYQMNSETGEWHHHTQLSFKNRKWLGNVDFNFGQMHVRRPKDPYAPSAPTDYDDCLRKGEEIFERAPKGTSIIIIPDQRQSFNAEAAELRWFLLPSEAKNLLDGVAFPKFEAPFTPRQYASDIQEYSLQHYSTIPARGSWPKLSIKENKPMQENSVGEKNGVEDPDCKNYLSDSGTFLSGVLVSNDEDEESGIFVTKSVRKSFPSERLWMSPTKKILKPTCEALLRYKMINNGDRVLICVSGGKDSLSLLHTLRQFQQQSKRFGIHFEIGAMTVDPGSSSYDPSPLIPYMNQLGIPYFYERQCIITKAMDIPDVDSICSFCSRLKRGRIYATARNHGFNVIALGQHLDDLAESFLMSTFHNGRLRTMKAAYANRERDLKIIRPFVYVREKELRHFATEARLPVIPENCPACFEAPKERHRIKQLLAQQELLFPCIYLNIKTSLLPLMSIDQPFVERKLFGKQSYIDKKEKNKGRTALLPSVSCTVGVPSSA